MLKVRALNSHRGYIIADRRVATAQVAGGNPIRPTGNRNLLKVQAQASLLQSFSAANAQSIASRRAVVQVAH